MSLYTEHRGDYWFDGVKYRLQKELLWHIGSMDGPVYTVPQGFAFDVSIPRWAQMFFSPHDEEFFKAACLHDHMLIMGWDRITAASQFHQALKADGVSTWRRIVMFLAVAFYRYGD